MGITIVDYRSKIGTLIKELDAFKAMTGKEAEIYFIGKTILLQVFTYDEKGTEVMLLHKEYKELSSVKKKLESLIEGVMVSKGMSVNTWFSSEDEE